MFDLCAKVATLADRDVLLAMMEDFNAIELIPWSRDAAIAPLELLLGSPQLGLVGLLHESDSVCGYFVLTWGFDLEWSGRDAFLTELYLLPDARGRGLGGAAMVEVERVAAQNEVRALHLMVRPENETALRLYRGSGFGPTPRIFLTKPIKRTT